MTADSPGPVDFDARSLRYKAQFPYTRTLMRQARRVRDSQPEAAAQLYARAQHYDGLLAHFGLTGALPRRDVRTQLRQAVNTHAGEHQGGLYLFESARYWTRQGAAQGAITCEPYLNDPDHDLTAALRPWTEAGWTAERYPSVSGEGAAIIVLLSPPDFLAAVASPADAGPAQP